MTTGSERVKFELITQKKKKVVVSEEMRCFDLTVKLDFSGMS